ncbi:HSP20-like chaperone [Paraphysoderma sedebokerense]|nr:HSP20-like chaperone [Paraphysoderma sedebokerense]
MTWSPKVDVFDEEKQVTVRADLPGVPKENIKVEARDNTLFLSGETQKQEERTSGTTRIRERFQGSFKRTLPLPVSADTENVQAKFDHGVLEVVIPKRERPGGRRITIQ